jgi:GxxExxY protein
MHADFSRAAELTGAIIGAAIEVHRDKGPGLIESIYQWCLEKELELNGLSFVSQKVVTVTYKGFAREEPLRFDVLVEGCVLVEAKAVAAILPIHKAQLLSYLKLLNVQSDCSLILTNSSLWTACIASSCWVLIGSSWHGNNRI